MRQPLDGRPNKWMGVISHVGSINALAIDTQGRNLLTAGQDDLNVNVWAVHIDKLEKNAIFNPITQFIAKFNFSTLSHPKPMTVSISQTLLIMVSLP